MADADKILRDLTDKIAIEEGFNHYSTEIKAISSGGANYTSALFLLTISGDKDDLKLFAKVANMGEKMRKSAQLKIYNTESYFYTTLTSIYRGIEKKYNVPVGHRISLPKFYGCNSNYLEETIVLEDLVNSGYSLLDRKTSMDWNFASKAVEELAKLHAISYAFARERPKEFEEALVLLKPEKGMSDDLQKTFFEKSFKSAVEAAKDEHKERLIRFTTNIDYVKFQEITKPLKKPVLSHGDYRVSNLMYKRNKSDSVKIIVTDFQTMQGTSPVLDLFYLIFTGTDEEFRRQYYQKLIDHYYEQKSKALRRFNINPEEVYSKKDFEKELSEKLDYGLMIAIFTLPIITVESENAPELHADADLTEISVEKVGDVYPERMRGIISDYVRWGRL